MSTFWHPFADMAEVSGHEFTISRGEGIYVYDPDDRPYLDAAGGLWYCHVGHGRREITDAISAQLSRLECYSTFGDLTNEPASQLCDRLSRLCEMEGPRSSSPSAEETASRPRPSSRACTGRFGAGRRRSG